MSKKKNNKTFMPRVFAIILRSWWVILFIMVCSVGYDLSVKKRKKAIAQMNNKYNSLLAEKAFAISKKEDLTLKLSSQSDPSWVEQVLMKELGVVPENKIKVHFKN